MFEKPANLPVLSKHGVQFILIKQAQRFWKTHTLVTFCLVFKSSPAQVGDEKTWKSPQRCNFFPQNRLYLDLMSTMTTELNNLVINNVQIKDRSILDEEVVCKYFHINTLLGHLVWNISMYSHGPEWPKQIHSSLFDYHAEFARKAFSLCNTEKEMKLKIKGK